MRTRYSAPLFALLLLAAGDLRADTRQGALGSDGSLYRVQAGMLSNLLPEVSGPDRAVLTLAVTDSAGQTRRWVVPGTEGEELESSAEVVYEEASDAAYLIWESRTNLIHSQIRLVRFSQGEFSSPMNLPGEFFSLKSSPSLAVTRDAYVAFGADGTPVAHTRTFYHAVWWEEAAAGERVIYSPVLLLDGVHVGWSPSFVLAEIVGPETSAPLLAPPSVELARQPIIQPGLKADTVVIGLTSPGSGRFLQFEAEVVSGELAAFARAAQAEISNGTAGQEGPALAERVRAQLVEFGVRLNLHPGLVSYLGGFAEQEILEAPLSQADGLVSLGERVRAQLVEFGVRMAVQGLGSGDASDQPTWLLEFPTADPTTPTADNQPDHSIRLRLVGDRQVPNVPSAPTSLYLSSSGQHAIVAWDAGARLNFRETTTAGWSEIRFLPIGPDLTLTQAHEILGRRVRNR